jgi:TRAP-type mannitol/chloroaromatic compound transport system permease small subunit
MLDRAISRFNRIVGGISDLGGHIAALAVALIMVLVCVEVFGRSLFRVSTLVADEYSGYLNVAVVFLGLSYTLKENGFIRVEVVYHRFRGAMKWIARWIIVLTSLVYVLIVVIYMARYVRYSYARGILSTQMMETPLYLPQAIIVVGSVILALQLFAYLLNRVRDLP